MNNPEYFETYSQTSLLLSEAVVRTYITGDAQAKGIIGNFKVGGPWWHINTDNVYANQEDPEQQ